MTASPEVAAVAGVLLLQNAATGEPTLCSEKQLKFKVNIFEGNPLGSRGAGTLRVLAAPRITALENQPFTFVLGGDVPVHVRGDSIDNVLVGFVFEGKVRLVNADKVYLDLTIAHSTIADRTEESIQIRTESRRTIATIKRGEVMTVRLPKRAVDKQIWAEVSVEELTP
jgi:hypothetical protein